MKEGDLQDNGPGDEATTELDTALAVTTDEIAEAVAAAKGSCEQSVGIRQRHAYRVWR